MKEDNKVQTESKTNVWEKASDISKKVAESAQKGVKSISVKTKSLIYSSQMKKYNPLFPEQYHSESFHLPNMIMIVDDAVRKNIEVCKGAIGWLSSETGMEVLYLYDEWVKDSGIQFVPTVNCDSAYYVDNFDRTRYIRVDCIFAKAHEEKIAELEHIAHALGAKNCSIEMVEATAEISVSNKKQEAKASGTSNAPVASASESIERSLHRSNASQRSGRIVTHFQGNNSPIQPTLKWFANDDNILRLIDMRCSDANSIHSKTLELSGSSSATMSQIQATTIDSAIDKMKNRVNSSMETQANKECNSKLIYIIEF